MGREKASIPEWSPEGQTKNFTQKTWGGQRGHRKVGRGWYSWKPVEASLSEIKEEWQVRAAKRSQRDESPFECRSRPQHPAEHRRGIQGLQKEGIRAFNVSLLINSTGSSPSHTCLPWGTPRVDWVPVYPNNWSH